MTPADHGRDDARSLTPSRAVVSRGDARLRRAVAQAPNFKS
ncbi:hypothetical protein [Actinocorallia sp. A-T 12471]|nr:hypothetical protein [Actinocorallia sp. A-T 12471]MDX6743939.1 hypothetical protein [Actinocorallia sp. A-T 12471]